ncbi:uncharacterized protein [Zea mays]|uniref:uncharacterized protein n=1 Tax=Zea mays TaxID=4577 RepID=UPI0009AA755E|nr:uncharacterized protein LOC109945905 [Zea mays]|eukprot:XP_020407881.1 uncharacterized protein LOC109945905 [Zea mays]
MTRDQLQSIVSRTLAEKETPTGRSLCSTISLPLEGKRPDGKGQQGFIRAQNPGVAACLPPQLQSLLTAPRSQQCQPHQLLWPTSRRVQEQIYPRIPRHLFAGSLEEKGSLQMLHQ